MRNLFLALSIILSSIFFTSCSSKEKKSIDVLVSTPPYIYFVTALSEGELLTSSIVPEGESPHIYEPSPKQVAEAHTASLWIRANEGFEQKIAKTLAEQKKNLVILNLAKKVVLLTYTAARPAAAAINTANKTLTFGLA